MASGNTAIGCELRQLFEAGTATGLSDGELLDRFLRRDEGSASAFEALLTRHGPAVWSTCRRHGPPALAEDVFQATFLILVRRAGMLRVDGSLTPWLTEVARRTALKAKTAEQRRWARESRAAVNEASRGLAGDDRRDGLPAPLRGRKATGQVSRTDSPLLPRGPHPSRGRFGAGLAGGDRPRPTCPGP